MKPANFDRLARLYRPLEFLAFGRDLERARFCLLDRLAACRSILVLGEGDGRCLARLVRIAPAARIVCLDASAAMLARARSRLPAASLVRVVFVHADATGHDFAADAFDAVVTLFFLDCFESEIAAAIVARLLPSLRPGARWLFADFAEPPSGFGRLRARAWLALLYVFFRRATGLGARTLPPSEAIIARAGFTPREARPFQHGLVRAVLFTATSAGAISSGRSSR